MAHSFVCPHGHQWEDTWGDALSLAGEGTLPCPVCGTPTEIPTATRPAKPPPPAPVQEPPGSPSAAGTLSGPTRAGFAAKAVKTARPLRIPGYDILAELGRGGMGVVYKARQEKLKRVVALKMILGGGHAGSKDQIRFRAEAEAVARMQHPNIVQIYEIGEHEEYPYFTMEFVEGGCLLDHIRDNKLTIRDRARLVATLARAMHAVHQKGIVHRDLKPANILLGIDGTPKITDFGLAKDIGETSGQTRTGDVMGTPSYMAPEQAEGRLKQIGPHTDVYALGGILYEMLTARPPFKAETAMDTLLLVLYEDPMPPAQLLPNCPRDLETICLKCLNKEIEKRYPSGEALAEDLERFIDGRPIQARPISRVESLMKWAKRRPAVAALAVVSTLAPLVVLAVSLLYNVRLDRLNSELAVTAEQKRQEAEKAESERARAERQEQEANRRREEADLLRIAADQHRRRAEENFRKAREAVKSMLTEVAQTELVNVPLMEDVRQRLLAKAVEFHSGFLEKQGKDPALRQQAGQAYGQLGDIYRVLGRAEQAESAYKDGLARFEELTREFSTEPDYRRDLGLVHFRMAELARTRDRKEEADRAYVAARTVQAKLVGEFPKHADYRFDLAHTINDMALVKRNAGQSAASRDLYREAIGLQDALVQEQPEARPEFREDLAGSWNDLGALHREQKEPGEAEKAYRTALGHFEHLVKNHPGVAVYKRKLAATCNNLGNLLVEQHGPAAGDKLVGDALRYRQELVKDFPSVLGYRQELAGAYQNWASLLVADKKFTNAGKACMIGIEIQRKLASDFPDVPEFQSQFAGMLDNLAAIHLNLNLLDEALKVLNESQGAHQKVRVKPEDNVAYRQLLRKHHLTRAETLLKTADKDAARHSEAARSATELVKLGADSADDQRVAAIILTGCSVIVLKDTRRPDAERKQLAEIYASQAVQALGRAVQFGWANPVELRTANAWAPLKARADFQKVLAEVDKKAMK